MSPQPPKPRFLIANGERLTKEEKYISGPKPEKSPIYNREDILGRLAPGLGRSVREISALPTEAMPQGRAVVMVTMHPEFLAKSSYPEKFFGSMGLRAVGSRTRKVEPKKWSKMPANSDTPKIAETIDLYMAGEAGALVKWESAIAAASADSILFASMGRIEDIRPLSDLNSEGRISITKAMRQSGVAEVALHIPQGEDTRIFPAFERYAASVETEVFRDLKIEVPGMIFVPVRGTPDSLRKLALFSFVRTIRPPVKLRSLPAARVIRSIGRPFLPPSEQPLNPAIRVAVLDGGLPDAHGLNHVASYQAPGVSAPHSPFTDHGLAVTGALMWGPLNQAPRRLYGSVDHFRVLDVDDATDNDVHAYEILRRVQDVIETGSHDLYNLSLGPDVPVDDDEVHAWTSTLDALSADGEKLIVAAAGNNGDLPEPLCRIQAPGDGVNCLCVGAADGQSDAWARASYSAKGPGRRPGRTKPDLMAFGGSPESPFGVLRKRGNAHVIDSEMGTSFAAPLVTRAALGLRSMFSASLHPLTLRCILIHSADHGGHAEHDVGWGMMADETELAICPDNTARVIYQGTLPPKKYLRARIPVPPGLKGRIQISATLCYATEISAADPSNYTNSGVEICYRPNINNRPLNKTTGKPSTYAATKPFFQSGSYASEEERRVHHRKWETVLHSSIKAEASKLSDPCFDLHFIPRQGVGDDKDARPIRYSMVISVHAPKHPDIYDRVLAGFPQLQALTPVIIQAEV